MKAQCRYITLSWANGGMGRQKLYKADPIQLREIDHVFMKSRRLIPSLTAYSPNCL
jgi:hypothetical protein